MFSYLDRAYLLKILQGREICMVSRNKRHGQIAQLWLSGLPGRRVCSSFPIFIPPSLDCRLSWWLKPAAAYRDGIIDKNTFPITADDNVAYAIVVSGEREKELQPNGRFKYHASLDDPGALKLSRTMTTDTPKIVRVLRSWKLRSPLAPKAGLRYDGL